MTARAPPLALRAAFAFAGRSGCGCSGAPRLWMRFQIRPAAAWELLKLFTGATPGRLLKVATKRSAGQASAGSASSFSLANESKGVVVAAAASAAIRSKQPRGAMSAIIIEPMSATQGVVVSFVAAAVLTLGACVRGDSPAAPPATSASPASAPATERLVGPLTQAEAGALATMNDRVKQYVKMHIKIERSLPKLPKEATPEQIDKNQRALQKMVQEARATAKPGDIFTFEARPVIKRLLANVFGGPDGKQLRASIMDENPLTPAAMKLTVNGRYPDTVPLTSVPPEVLQTLPKLTEDLEYRFIGDSLILLDVHAHVIADFIEDAVPK